MIFNTILLVGFKFTTLENVIGTVAVRYSPTCKSAWSRVTSKTQNQLYAQITRRNSPDGVIIVQFPDAPSFQTGTALRSPMVYAKTPSVVSALGNINNQSFNSTGFLNPRQ